MAIGIRKMDHERLLVKVLGTEIWREYVIIPVSFAGMCISKLLNSRDVTVLVTYQHTCEDASRQHVSR